MKGWLLVLAIVLLYGVVGALDCAQFDQGVVSVAEVGK
jgi:hypothetical protein